MNIVRWAGALALGLGVVAPSVALADDPRDPTMRNREARERDAAEIRRLNNEQARYVRARDARYAKGWQAYREYPDARSDYDRRMAEWRHAVRMCETGHYEYCAR